MIVLTFNLFAALASILPSCPPPMIPKFFIDMFYFGFFFTDLVCDNRQLVNFFLTSVFVVSGDSYSEYLEQNIKSLYINIRTNIEKEGNPIFSIDFMNKPFKGKKQGKK